MRFLSVCSGIEAASVAWSPLGWKAVAFSEIEPFPCAVLAHHYPDTPNWGDMTKYKEWPDVSIDLLCGGTPCQSFSVAGLRKGLDDPRGNLMLTFGAIAAKYRPKWLVWENVPGVLSSNGGRDFGSFLGLLGVLGYGFAYRVLDAQYFGVAQRLRRVFVVGCLGDWRSAAAVLFERHSLQGHTAPRREAGQGSAAGTLRSTQGGSDVDHARAGHLAFGGNNTRGPIDIATALNASASASASGRMDFESETFIAHSLRGEGFDASEDGTGRGTPLVPVGVDGFNASLTGAVAATMGTRGSSETASGPQVLVSTIAFPANLSATQHASTENLSPSLGALNPTAVAFNMHKSGNEASSLGISTDRTDRTDCLRAFEKSPFAVAYTTKLHNTQSNQAGKVYEEYTVGLDRNSPPPALLTAMQVRRLTPTEAERLMGFPDDYTLIPHRKKPAADGPRYKALGNSWAVPNVRWIGERIDAVQAIKSAGRKAA